jgi:hypothetical protein
VDGLSTTPDYKLGCLNLGSNPGISAQGYGALFNHINVANVVGYFPCDFRGKWHGFCLDDKAWEGKLNLVAEMNSTCNRLEYMTNGTFTSEEHRLQWLENLVRKTRDIGDFYDGHFSKELNTKYLNFIWYTLRQNPEMMQT